MNKHTILPKIMYLFNCFLVILSGCIKEGYSSTNNKVYIIHSNYFVGENGIIYDDMKTTLYKCYFDFNSMTNVFFCSKPNCDHTDIDCVSRLCYPYTFFIDDDQYYITKNIEMRDNKETFISYLNKSDVSSTKTKIVAEIDGDIISDIYLSNNTLHLIAAKYKFVDGLSTSIERWDLYQINMKNYSVKRITLNDKEGIDTYLPYGVINNKMIIYHRYYTNIINPNDYGIESNVEDYIDTENFNEFMSALSEAYRMDMIALDLASGEITYLDLPIPLLVYGNCYYYNKKTTEGSYELVSFDFITKEEKVICDLPVNYIYALNDRLYITEGNVMKSKYSDNTSVGYKENAKEFIYDLTTHELRELKATLPEKTEIKLLAEVGDYYIILHNDVRGKVTQRIGYILKEDYYNDKSKYTLVPPI